METIRIQSEPIPELMPEGPTLPYTAYYKHLCKIGSGCLGDVFLVRDLESNKRFALKLARKKEDTPYFQHEGMFLSHLSHPGIVGLKNYRTSAEGLPAIITEYCEGESLSNFLLSHKPLDEFTTRTIGEAVADILNYIHGQNIIHRDIKPGNIQCTPTGFKLLDFNSAYLIGTAHLPSVPVTDGYIAPEIVPFMDKNPITKEEIAELVQLFTPAIDFYSLGMTLYACLQGTPIPKDMLEKPIPKISPQFESILAGLMSKTPQKRIEAAKRL